MVTLGAAESAAQEAEAFLDAQASDPIKVGWMLGAPPPTDKIIRFDDGSYLKFPQLRWSFSHWRELRPTVRIWRGTGPVSLLPRAERDELDAVTFLPHGASQEMTWEQSLAANYTDGIVVLHKGAIVYERYFGALKPEGLHIAFSVTKSFIGVIAASLISENSLDANATVGQYLPELENSGFGNATVSQVSDMTTSLRFDETYGDTNSDIWRFSRAAGVRPKPPAYTGPVTIYDFLRTVKREGNHGQEFMYRSINTEVLAWIISRVTGQGIEQLLSDRLWRPLGMESDGYIGVDAIGTAWASGGLNLQLRDLARFGEMMRMNGRFNGRQIVPEAVVAEIRHCGRREGCARADSDGPSSRSYHNQWWVMHNDHGAFAGRGVYGQTVYIDPKAEMVVARFASHPLASNINNDATSLPAYQALAEQLMRAKP
ncbi:MAG: serine hydrolase [Halioglobus sp.]|nr:serine hydrolase [Halioglobus sp.]